MNPLYKIFFCLYEKAEKKKREQNEISLTPWFDVAKAELARGVEEIPGSKDNPRIIEYHACTSLKATDDETAWCSSFQNFCCQKAGYKGTRSAAARSWLNWDEGYTVQLKDAKPGAICIFQRGDSSWQGHVGMLYRPYDGKGYLSILGGNQSNKVSVASYPANKLLGVRWPKS